MLIDQIWKKDIVIKNAASHLGRKKIKTLILI